MTKKHFIALADAIREHDSQVAAGEQSNVFQPDQLRCLARFCRAHNSQFNWERWFLYIAGDCGPNGGAIKTRG